MAYSSSIFCCRLLKKRILILLLFLANKCYAEYLRKELSLSKPYQNAFWDIVGSTMITGQYARLTADAQSQKGALWNINPVRSHNWEIHIQFSIHGKGSDGLHGDGFAFWYAKEPGQLGPVFGNKDFFTGLAITVDTYSNHNGPHNHRHPYVSAIVNNGSIPYDHDADGTHIELAGCETNAGRNKPYESYMAIRYLDNKLMVSLDVENKNEWKECFTVDQVFLPTGFYIGLSAATGDLADNHDVVSVKFYELESEQISDIDYSKVEPSASFFAPPRDHTPDNKPGFFSGGFSGLKLLLVIILVVVGLGVVAVVGFLVFQKQQDNARKRFY